MNSKELRKKYLEFFESKGHLIVPSDSLIPENDSTTLFTGSGMQPMIPYLLGEKHPGGKRLADSQKCFRTGDMEKVGDNRHNTFFEMLGNWSFGDYFKLEQIEWIFEFLIEEIKLEPEKLYITVFRGNEKINIPKDSEAVKKWQACFLKYNIKAKDVDNAEVKGMQDGRIFYYSDDKNWWSRVGKPDNMPIGEPGGPDSEMFYDLGADLKKHENSEWKNKPCHVNCDCGRFIEIGNNVFMEYIRTKGGFIKLKQKNVDFGGGLERLIMVAQGKDNIFETDLFINIINKISELSGGKTYKDNFKAFEIIADHLKAATFIMSDERGIYPSNTDQGYIVRRLIRRAIRYGRQLGITESPWTKEIAKIVAHDYGDIYPELIKNINKVIDQFKEEEIKFAKTLEQGLKEFEKLSAQKIISGKQAFDLYQTYGFPFEITEELALEKNQTVNKLEFEHKLNQHKNLSRTASAGMFKGGLADTSEATIKYHTAAHLLLAALRKVLGEQVIQKGSNITAERLRFDFSHDAKMTEEEKKQVEILVNQAIKSDLPVICEEMTLEEARKKGAHGIFDSKYGEKVKIYAIGDKELCFSREICGGPHVDKIGNLGNFKIKKEESSSSGVRRIKAILE